MSSFSDYEIMRHRIPLYINGSLTESARREFEREIWRNRALGREYRDFLAIEAAFRSMERQAFPDPDAAIESIMARARKSAALAARHRWERRRVRNALCGPRVAWTLLVIGLLVLVLLLVR